MFVSSLYATCVNPALVGKIDQRAEHGVDRFRPDLAHPFSII
jgi:hypothetical protein